MNYTENINPVVPVSDDTPSKLSELKSSIIARTNHNIPFFLMPVRMETRFMKPLRSIFTEVYTVEVISLTGVIASIGTLLDKVTIYGGFDTTTAHMAAVELKNLFSAADEAAHALTTLQPVEKADLLRGISSITSLLPDAKANILASSTEQTVTDDIETNLFPALDALISSIESFTNNATLDTGWLSGASYDGNNLANLINTKTSTINFLLPQLGSGPNFHMPTFNTIKNELNDLVKELNNFAVDFNLQDQQLVWMKMENMQLVLNDINNAVNSAPPNPQLIADMELLNKKLISAWHNFSQNDESSLEWIPAPENKHKTLSEDNLAEVAQGVLDIGDGIETLLTNNDANFDVLDNTQGPPNLTILTSIVDSFDQIKDLLLTISAPLSEFEILYLWAKISRVSSHLTHAESLIETLSATNPSAASTLTASISLTSYSLKEEWIGVAGIGGTIDVINAFSFYTAVNELWIRVYPDDIFIHNHEEDLTEKEKDAGTEFWKEWWAARGDKAKEIAAWRALIALFGVTRAAWIVKALTPTTISSTSTSTKASTVVAKIGVLSTYTTKISTVITAGSVGVVAALPHFISHYTPHLDYLTGVIAELPHMTASMISIAADEVTSIKAEFSTLGTAILSEDSQLASEISGIEAKFNTLLSTIENTQSITSWEINYDAEPTFPVINVKASGWTAAAFTRELPDSFVFATIDPKVLTPEPPSYKFKHIKVGNPIPLTLQVGIHPESSVFDLDAFSNLKLDPELKWMFDFDEAVRIGMGITIRLTDSEANDGFDKVLALGVKLGVTAGVSTTEAHNYGKDLVEDLFKNHHYSNDGMSILKLGTPTNNTDNDVAGYKIPDEDGSLSFATELGAPLFSRSLDKLKRKDGQWIADALGLEYDIFYHIENANKRQISGAIAMNYSLWPGTIGNFMSEMMHPIFSKDNINRTKKYFSEYVLGRNTIPSIRVGSQPYGILPTTAYTRWKFPFGNHEENIPSVTHGGIDYDMLYSFSDHYKTMTGSDSFFQERFNIRFLNVLKELNNTWLDIVKTENVKTIDKNTGSANTQKDFMEILGTDALMSEVYSRFMVNSSTFKNAIDDYDVELNSKWDSPNIKIPTEIYSLLKKLRLTSSISGLGIDTPIFDDFIVQNLWFLFSDPTPGGTMTWDDIVDYFSKILTNTNSILNVDFIKEDPTSTGIKSRGEYILKGPSVDEKVLSPSDTLTPIKGVNYVEWLLKSSLNDVWKNNEFGTMQSRSLLFLLLRQSLLTVYKNTATDTLVSLNEFSQTAINSIGHSRGIAGQIIDKYEQLILTKWHLLFSTKDFLLDSTKGYSYAYEFFSEPYTSSWSAENWWLKFYPRPTAWFPAAFNDVPLADFLSNKSAYSARTGYSTMDSNTNWEPIEDLRKGFEHIKDLPTSDLDLLLREHIDLASYRLDAWNAGMVNKRLWDNRNVGVYSRQKGLYVGAYGWLLDVRPKSKGVVKVDASSIPTHLKDSSDQVYHDNEALGFIHTPSISHSLTAAILRSGYMSERNSSDNKFAINLSSERVQLAMSILEGMRNGQTLNAILGYMFERGLHENYAETLELDAHISNFRKAFPLEGALISDGISEAIKPNNVVDGIELLNAVRMATLVQAEILANPDKTIYEIYQTGSIDAAIFGPFTLSSFPLADRNAIMVEIDRIANAVDAVADLAIAEGVFQIAKGNAARSAATMEAYTTGKNPPIPEIVNTPISGTKIAHKLVSALSPKTGTLTSPWSGVSMSPRATVEPTLNQWVADILFNLFPGSTNVADEIGCVVTYTNIEDGLESFDVSLKDLNIQALDLIYLIKDDAFNNQFIQRISSFVRKTADGYDYPNVGVPSIIPLTIELSNKGAKPFLASFSEIACLLNSVGHLIVQSRYLKASDFLHSANPVSHSGTVPPYYNYSELQTRCEALYDNFDADIRVYFQTTILPPADDTELNALRGKLTLACDYGIDFALPNSIIETFTESMGIEMFELFERVKFEVLKRFSNATNIKVSIASLPTEVEKVNAWIEMTAELLGASFKTIPHFSFDYYTGLEIQINNQLTDSSTAGSGIMRHHNTDAIELKNLVEDWIFGLARVQDKVAHIETVRMLLQEDEDHPLKELLPVQFPYVDGTGGTTMDFWLGASYPEDFDPQGDKFSTTIFNPDELKNASTYGYYAGLVFSEWDEVIPEKEVTTGISFNYDQPNAKAPQNALLAVHPNYEGTWTLDDLWFTLLDTIEMAKIRMVEPDHFKKISGDSSTDKFEIFKWVLPAIVGEVTPHNIDLGGDHISYQGSESVQQVSFEYNPNNDKIPSEYIDPLEGSPETLPDSSSFLVKEGSDWDKLDADSILTDPPLSDFMLFQDQLTSVAVTQREMKEMQEVEEIITNPQQ